MMFELVTAANFMDIKPLLDLTCLAVSVLIKVSLYIYIYIEYCVGFLVWLVDTAKWAMCSILLIECRYYALLVFGLRLCLKTLPISTTSPQHIPSGQISRRDP